mgnify:CR=1 FL=1
MLRIGFVIQSSRYNYEPFRNQPLGVLYLLTILEKHFGERVKLSTVDLRGVDEKSFLYHIPENDVFLYSVASIDFHEISEIVQGLRSIYPKAKHIAGGPHIDIFPKHSSTVFDAVVLGEGEESIVNVINDIFAAGLKPVYRQEKPVDLDSHPYP